MKSEVEIVGAVARALNGSVDVREALDAVLSTVAEYLGLAAGWVWLAGEDGYEVAAARQLPSGFRNDPAWTQGSCWCQKRFDDGGMQAGSVEQIECSRLDALTEGADGFRYHASLPLIAGSERLGILNIASRDGRALSDGELAMLRAVSDMLAVALERARLYERSREVGAAQERARLSREMHDTIAQSLTALVMQLEVALPTTEGAVLGPLQLARQCLADTRTAVSTLRESPFGDVLRDGVQRAVSDVATRTGLDVAVSFEPTNEPPARVVHAGCRVVQEALTNVARHSNVSDARVALSADNHGFKIEISDSGSGFESASQTDSFGLRGMRERARLVEAELEIATGPSGTTVTFSWSPT